MRKLLPPLLITLLLSLGPAAAETLVVGLPEPGRVPFFWQDAGKDFQGSYVELLRRIGAELGVDMEFRMLPQARLIAEFNAGRIDIEPGVAPAWRPSPEEAQVSRYTVAFMNMEDVLIFPRGRSLPDIASMAELGKLKGLRIGQVRGFFVPEGLDPALLVSELDIARLVANGAMDAGFMNATVAAYYKTQYSFDFQISPPFASTPVSFRFNSLREKWIAPFNEAIEALRRSGELQKILARPG